MGLPEPTAVMSAPRAAAWLLVVVVTLSSTTSTSSSSPHASPRDALLWRADAANAQGPHYRQSLSSPLKLLGGGVPVPATPSQKIALKKLNGFRGRPGQRRFVGARRQEVTLGSDQDIDTRVRQQQPVGLVSPPERAGQATLKIELHPEEQLGEFS